MSRESAYMGFYNLKKDPFAIPESYSPVGKRHELLEQLIHLNQFSHMVLAVIAPEEYGKTTIYNMLAKQLELQSDLQVVKFTPENSIPSIDLLQQIAHAWQVEDISFEKETLLRQLRSHNLSQSFIGMRHCILIDNAEVLGEDALNSLHELTSGMPEEQAIGLTLFCKEGSVDLRSIFKPADSLHLIYMQALSNKDVFGFIQDHFITAGHKQGLPFPPEVVEKIYIASEGIPGRIKKITKDYMIEQAGELKKSAPGAIPKLHIYAISGLVLVILGSLIFQIFSFGEGTKVIPEPTKTVISPVSEKLKQAVSKVESRQKEAGQTVDTEPKQNEAGQSVIEIPIVLGEKPVEAKSITQDALLPVPQQEVIVAKETPVTQPPEIKKTWIDNVEPSAFTIQLLGARTQKAVTDFIGNQDRPESFNFHETQHEGNRWFIVTYGIYDIKENATQAVKLLPENLKKQSPWIRSIQSILDADK